MRSVHRLLILCLTFVLLLPSVVLAEVDITDKVEVIKGRMISDRRTGDALIDVSIKNISADLFFQPVKVVVDQISSSAVTVANADGFTDDGKPFFLYSDLGDVFEPNERSLSKRYIFHNPTRVRFSYSLQILAEVPESAAVIGIGGGVIEVTDPDSSLVGVMVEFSENSLEENTIVTIEESNITFPMQENSYSEITKQIKVDSSHDFKGLVKVKIPLDVNLDDGEYILIAHYDEDDGYFSLIPVYNYDNENKYIEFYVSSFSYLQAIKLTDLPGEDQLGMDIFMRYQYPMLISEMKRYELLQDGLDEWDEENTYFIETLTDALSKSLMVREVGNLDYSSGRELAKESVSLALSTLDDHYIDSPGGELLTCGADWLYRYVEGRVPPVSVNYTFDPATELLISCGPTLLKQSYLSFTNFYQAFSIDTNFEELNNINILIDYVQLYYSTSGNLYKMHLWTGSEDDTKEEIIKAIGIHYDNFLWADLLSYGAEYDLEKISNLIDSTLSRIELSKSKVDLDSDLIARWNDNCQDVANYNQADYDSDGFGDLCDNCVSETNSDQIDSDYDGVGDACDNCPNYDNPDQEDLDDDSIGNQCDDDADGDGYLKPNPISSVFDCNDLVYDLTNTCIDYTIQEKLSEGFDALSSLSDFGGNTAESYLAAINHFQQAGEVVALDSSATQNETDQALFFSSLARLAKIAKPYSDLTDNGLNNLGDILDAFGIGGTNNDRDYLNQIPIKDCSTVVDWTDPDTGYQYTHEECSLKEISPDSPTSGELQQFLTDKVVSELQIAIENLGKVSPTFNKEWIDPSDNTVTEFDYADALAVKGFMQAMLAQIKLTNAYNFDVNLADEQQSVNSDLGHSAGDVLALNPSLGVLENPASLNDAETYIELSANNLISAINTMDQENADGDDQSDDLISFYSCGYNPNWSCGYDTSASSDLKDKLTDVLRSLVLSTDIDFKSPVDGKVYPLAVRFFNIFNGLDIRNQLPVVTDNTTGFFPDPTLNGVIDPTQFDINEDRDADGHPDLANDYTNFFEGLVSDKQTYGGFNGPEGSSTELFKFHSDHTVDYQWSSYDYVTNQQHYGQGDGQWEIDSSTKELVVSFSSPINTWVADGQMDSIRVDLISGEYSGGEVAERHFLGSTDLTPISRGSQWWFSEIQSYGLLPQINPYVTVNPSVGYVSESTLLEEYGYGFTPKGSVKLHLIDPNDVHSVIQVTADYLGNHYHTYQVHSGSAVGEWEYYAVDESTGIQTASVFVPILQGDTTLPAPSLSSPSSWSLVGSVVPLRWSYVSGNYGYKLQIGSLPEMDITANQYDATLQPGTYPWKVCTKNSDGVCVSWSSTWSFTVEPASAPTLPAPNLSSPSSGALVGSVVPLRWSYVSGNYGYKLQIGSLPEMDITANQYDATLQLGTYPWKVCTKNSAGVCGSWSSSWLFTVE